MRAPLHLWIIGLLSLLWNAGGGVDYVGVKLQIPQYMAMQPPGAAEFFAAAPAWFSVAWAVGVWFSILGSVLLLMRSRIAGSVFSLSLLGLLAASYYSFVMVGSSPMRDAGPAALAFTAAIYVVLILLIIYSRAMTRNGVLR